MADSDNASNEKPRDKWLKAVRQLTRYENPSVLDFASISIEVAEQLNVRTGDAGKLAAAITHARQAWKMIQLLHLSGNVGHFVEKVLLGTEQQSDNMQSLDRIIVGLFADVSKFVANRGVLLDPLEAEKLKARINGRILDRRFDLRLTPLHVRDRADLLTAGVNNG